MASYRVHSTWQVDAPVDRAWDAVLRYADWPAWWRGFVGVDLIRSGDDIGVGTVLRQRWRGWLPYTLEFDLEITHVERRRVLEGRVSGPVAGTAAWEFRPTDRGSEVTFTLDVRTTRAWMNLPVPFRRRVFESNFGAIMGWGREGLRRHLAAGVEAPGPGERAARA